MFIKYNVRKSRLRFQPVTRSAPPLEPSQPDSLQHFLLERYLLFVERRGQMWRGQVHHQPYPIQKVEVTDVSDSLIQAAGIKPVSEEPACTHYSPGVDVEIMNFRPVSN